MIEQQPDPLPAFRCDLIALLEDLLHVPTRSAASRHLSADSKDGQLQAGWPTIGKRESPEPAKHRKYAPIPCKTHRPREAFQFTPTLQAPFACCRRSTPC